MPRPRVDTWLIPLAYLAHVAEEYLAGFPRWAGEAYGIRQSEREFLAWNALGLALVTLGIALHATGRPRLRWIANALAFVLLSNTAAHALACLWWREYHPGLASALLLWAPLGVWTAREERFRLSGVSFLRSAAAGILIHAFSLWLALR